MIFAGLGNPGERYRGTFHNLGFLVIDLIAERWGRPDFRDKFKSQFALAARRGAEDRHVLMKPQTFMNLSGESLQAAAQFYKASRADFVVIHDELDLPLGRIQLKVGGGAGGHNGIKSAIQCLGGGDFVRLRLGIGRPPADFPGDVADYVLHAVPPADREIVDSMILRAAETLELILDQGLSPAMNLVNRRAS